MVVATVILTFFMFVYQGAWFEGRRGFPFAWYWWTDISINGSPTHGYRWGGLVADVVICLVAVIVFGILVERTAQRIVGRNAHTSP